MIQDVYTVSVCVPAKLKLFKELAGTLVFLTNIVTNTWHSCIHNKHSQHKGTGHGTLACELFSNLHGQSALTFT